jgi:hypothetical protein
VHLQTNRRSTTYARWRGRTGSGSGARIGEEEEGGRGGCIFIRPGAFRTMEHVLAMRVSVPASPGRTHIHSAMGISNNGALVGDEG